MYEQDEKFNEFWSENYKAHFGYCEPYKGIAEYAYEQGWNEGRRKLEEENRRLAALVENIRNCGNCKNRLTQSIADILGDENGEPCCRCDNYDKWEVCLCTTGKYCD